MTHTTFSLIKFELSPRTCAHFFALLLCALIISTLNSSIYADEKSTIIKPDHAHINTMGRFTNQYQFGWTATAIKFRTTATTIHGLFTLEASKQSALQVVIDGIPAKSALLLSKDKTEYPIAQHLTPGEHTIEIWKRSEGYMGQIKFGGLLLNTNATLIPLERPTRRLMVMGDSISCGYGNEAKSPNEGNSVQNENGYMAYGPITARKLNAEIMNISWSGSGISRTRDTKDDQKNVIPKLFDRTLPLKKNEVFDHSTFIPQVIVINLGTNDVSKGSKKAPKPALTKEGYSNAYIAFIKTLRGHYPDSHIIIAIGPMAYGPMDKWLADIAQSFERVHPLIFPKYKGKQHAGGHWHPNVAMHVVMADALTAKIKDICKW